MAQLIASIDALSEKAAPAEPQRLLKFERKVSLGQVTAWAVQLAGLVAFAVQLQSDVRVNTNNIADIRHKLEGFGSLTVKIERIDERLSEVKDNVRRLLDADARPAR